MYSFYFENEGYVLKYTKKLSSKNKLIYSKNLNMLKFPRSFTARDYDVFFTICWYAKQQKISDLKNTCIEIPFNELSRFYEKSINTHRLYDEICDFVEKVWNDRLNVYREFTDKNERFGFGGDSLFLKLFAYKNERILSFKLNDEAFNMLFDIFNFMSIDMGEFVSIRGKFAKSLYRLLKQYENLPADANGKKVLNFSKEKFADFMNISDDYDSCDIDRRVLTPAVKELGDGYFNNLLFERRYVNKKGKEVVGGYSFSFVVEEK